MALPTPLKWNDSSDTPATTWSASSTSPVSWANPTQKLTTSWSGEVSRAINWMVNPAATTNVYTYDDPTVTYDSPLHTYDGITPGEDDINETKPTGWSQG